jgi:hypothetical protein
VTKLLLNDPHVNAGIGEKASPSMSEPMDMNPFGDSGFYPMPGRELPDVRIVETPAFVTDEEPTDDEGRTLLEVLAEVNECLGIAANDTPLTALSLEDCYTATVEVDVAHAKGCDLITTELTPQSEEEYSFVPKTGERLLGEGP